MKNLLSILFGTFFMLVLFSACTDDPPEVELEEEEITTLFYTLDPDDGGDAVIFSFRDLDGEGGDAPTILGGTLKANTNYTGTLNLLNEAESPTESITEEIRELDEEHQFFFARSEELNVSFAYVDVDENNQPVGLETQLQTGDASEGMLQITLRHEPNKSAAGVSNGQIDNAGGETDIEVIFDVTIVE